MEKPVQPVQRGGCLCKSVRYEIHGDALYAGYCCCADCQKASGSGFVPFIGIATGTMTMTGATIAHSLPTGRSVDAVRNFCPTCGAMVYGGFLAEEEITLYAGSLDDPAWFQPKIAIFVRSKPAWVILPTGLRVFETMP